jgi:hypothetical protein
VVGVAYGRTHRVPQRAHRSTTRPLSRNDALGAIGVVRITAMLDHRADVRQDATGDIAEPPPDPWFNPYRQPASERAWAIVRDIAGQVRSFETYAKVRKRKRKANDQASFEAIIAAIVSDQIP